MPTNRESEERAAQARVTEDNLDEDLLSDASAPYLSLDEAYAQMAADAEREAEALEWIEALIADVADDT